MGRKSIGAVVVALAIVCASGCGSTKPLTRAQFVDEVNGVCRRAHVRVQAVFRNARGQPPAETRARWFTAIRAMAKDLDRLDAPDALRPTFTAYVGAMRTQFAIMTGGEADHDSAATRRQEDANHTARKLAAQMHLGRFC